MWRKGFHAIKPNDWAIDHQASSFGLSTDLAKSLKGYKIRRDEYLPENLVLEWIQVGCGNPGNPCFL